MNRSRTRQFGAFRNNQTQSMKSEVSSISHSRVSQASVSEACVNCVNNIMARRKQKQRKREHDRERQQYKQMMANSKPEENPQKFRNQMNRKAMNENRDIIESHLRMKEKQKQYDRMIVEEGERIAHKAAEMHKKEQQVHKAKQIQYYREIHDQFMEQEEKRKKLKHSKLEKQENQGLPIYHDNHQKQKIKHGRELLAQIEQKKLMALKQAQQEKLTQARLNKQFEEEVRKYHSDNYEQQKLSKQEFESAIKMHEQKKKSEKQRQRQEQIALNLNYQRYENQVKSKDLKRKMQQMQKYVNELKDQMLQREKRLRDSKLEDQNFVQKVNKSTEEARKQLEIQKQCKACHKQVPVRMIGPVPKKV